MTKMTVTEMWNVPTETLMDRIKWLCDQAPIPNKEHDEEYLDILAVLCVRDDEEVTPLTSIQ